MEEIWKNIKDYEELYQVSNLGRIRRKTSIVNRRDGTSRIVKGKILNQRRDKSNRLRVSLCKDGIYTTFIVSRLVALAFIENTNPEKFTIVNHKDENPDNNIVDNLEWCDYSYNVHYGNAINKMKQKMGKKVIRIDIKTNLEVTYNSIREAAKENNVNRTAIINCCKKKLHYNTAGGYIWKYKL